MNSPFPRRSFLKAAAGTGAAVGLGQLGFLSRLPSVSAAEAVLDTTHVQFRPEIEPLVRLLEDTSREQLLEEVGARIKRGTTYREVLTALQLAGVRNIQPRPSALNSTRCSSSIRRTSRARIHPTRIGGCPFSGRLISSRSSQAATHRRATGR
jgi:hypothetical protein